MSTKFMIIDEQADFRSLLMHHVTSHWPDAIISAYDPISAGYLPDEFSGAGNDVVLLGNKYGDRDGLEVLKRFTSISGFPPVVFFGSSNSQKNAAFKFGAEGFFRRDQISHRALIVRLSDALRSREKAASTDSLFVGDTATGLLPLIKGYRFVQKLALSEHSVVYLAEREPDGARVALKVLRQTPDATGGGIGAFDRFLQEYEIIGEMDHPNIVKIFDLGVSDEHAHIAMEFLGGGDLRQRMEEGLSERDAIDITKQIGAALAAIHAVGILHRDLKPGNIMLREDGSVALIDFGLAKRMRLEQEITDSGQIFGTPYYMSPEQGHGEGVDARSDIYSLGVLMYEMLTGEKPYLAGSAMGIIYKHCEAPVPLLPHRLAEYQALLNMLMAKRPDDRLQSAGEISEWLQ